MESFFYVTLEDRVSRFTPDVTYQPAPLCCVFPCWRNALTVRVGGGFIESFAFGHSVCCGI